MAKLCLFAFKYKHIFLPQQVDECPNDKFRMLPYLISFLAIKMVSL